MPQPHEYTDEGFCDHCDKYTPHRYHDSGHERDSSHDWRECTVCKWICYGLSGEYRPPIKIEDEVAK